jgi:hypothetical protein
VVRQNQHIIRCDVCDHPVLSENPIGLDSHREAESSHDWGRWPCPRSKTWLRLLCPVTDRLRYFPAAIVTVTRGSTLCGAHPHRAMFPACTQSCDALSRGEQFSIATDLFAHPASIYWRDWLFSKKHHPSSHACSPIAIDSRHVAGRVDRRPYAEVGNTL